MIKEGYSLEADTEQRRKNKRSEDGFQNIDGKRMLCNNETKGLIKFVSKEIQPNKLLNDHTEQNEPMRTGLWANDRNEYAKTRNTLAYRRIEGDKK